MRVAGRGKNRQAQVEATLEALLEPEGRGLRQRVRVQLAGQENRTE